MTNRNKDSLYSNSVNTLKTVVVKEGSQVFESTSASEAVYTLYESRGGKVITSKSLSNNQITRVDIDYNGDTVKGFSTVLSAADINVKPNKYYWHTMVITNVDGDVLPPVFNEQVTVE